MAIFKAILSLCAFIIFLKQDIQLIKKSTKKKILVVWVKLNEENINLIQASNISEEKLSCLKLALAINSTSNNSQTTVRNVKISFQAYWEVNFTISLKNLGVYFEKN